jgi:hypothetical protein
MQFGRTDPDSALPRLLRRTVPEYILGAAGALCDALVSEAKGA